MYYVFLYGHHLQQKSVNQPGKVAYPARGHVYGKMNISLSPFAPENLVSRDGSGHPAPRQPARSPHLRRIWCLLAELLPRFPRRRPFIYYTANRPRVSREFISGGSLHRAESPPAQGQQFSMWFQ